MHCVSCAMNIDLELEGKAGVKEANTSYVKSETQVTYDPKIITPLEIIGVIKRTGYQASLFPKS